MGVKSFGSQHFFSFFNAYARSPKFIRHQRQRKTKTIKHVYKTYHCSILSKLQYQVIGLKSFGSQSFFYMPGRPNLWGIKDRDTIEQQRRRTTTQVHNISRCSLPFSWLHLLISSDCFHCWKMNKVSFISVWSSNHRDRMSWLREQLRVSMNAGSFHFLQYLTLKSLLWKILLSFKSSSNALAFHLQTKQYFSIYLKGFEVFKVSLLLTILFRLTSF